MHQDDNSDLSTIIFGIFVGLIAASIGALYTVYARWGIINGLTSPDLTALRFGVAGILTFPLLLFYLINHRTNLILKWRIWVAIACLAGTPFGLLMFGALQFAPTSHAAVFPFSSMSVMGMILGAIFLNENLTRKKLAGITLVLFGLIIVSGLDFASFAPRTILGDVMFIVAGSLWAGFGILLRKHQLDPIMATVFIAFSALITYIPFYLWSFGTSGLQASPSKVFWVEVLVQGVIGGCGTLYIYAKMVSLLGASRAAMFPALAPGLAAILAWPILDHIPTNLEIGGLLIVMIGLFIGVFSQNKKQIFDKV